jgi:hypothetical protein
MPESSYRSHPQGARPFPRNLFATRGLGARASPLLFSRQDWLPFLRHKPVLSGTPSQDESCEGEGFRVLSLTVSAASALADSVVGCLALRVPAVFPRNLSTPQEQVRLHVRFALGRHRPVGQPSALRCTRICSGCPRPTFRHFAVSVAPRSAANCFVGLSASSWLLRSGLGCLGSLISLGYSELLHRYF